MHRLVQGQHEEALSVRGELALPSSGRRFGRLVEIGLAQRLEKLQVLFAQLKILLPNLGEGWIRAGLGDGFRVLAKVLLPFCRGILVSEKYGRDHALHQREMPQPPERGTPRHSASETWLRRRSSRRLRSALPDPKQSART